MNLIEILNSNGTGLLSGTCRLLDPHFSSFVDFAKQDTGQGQSKVRVAFSLNEKDLGIFEIETSGYIFEKHFHHQQKAEKRWIGNSNAFGCYATLPNIWLEITWDSREEEFATFKAINKIFR